MYRLTHIFPDENIEHHDVGSVRETLMTVGSLLVDAQAEPRVARRFALYLTRQPLGQTVRQATTGHRFRIDEEKAADEADATPRST